LAVPLARANPQQVLSSRSILSIEPKIDQLLSPASERGLAPLGTHTHFCRPLDLEEENSRSWTDFQERKMERASKWVASCGTALLVCVALAHQFGGQTGCEAAPSQIGELGFTRCAYTANESERQCKACCREASLESSGIGKHGRLARGSSGYYCQCLRHRPSSLEEEERRRYADNVMG